MTLDEPQEAPAPRRRAALGARDSELARRLSPELPTDTAVSWWVTIGITVFATLVRFVNLGQPHAVSFDETYNMKDAWSLLRSCPVSRPWKKKYISGTTKGWTSYQQSAAYPLLLLYIYNNLILIQSMTCYSFALGSFTPWKKNIQIGRSPLKV